MSHASVRNETLRARYDLVERVIAAMKSRIDQPLSLPALAKIGLASPSHFIRTFREVTGVTPSQFLYALRLDRARRLLMHTRRKVIDICYDVGYNSVGTFTRRFTDLLGISPTAFRTLAQTGPAVVTPDASPLVADTGARRPGHSIPGYVGAPSGFQGLAFVGLFETPVPQGTPLACAIAAEDGAYQIEDAPEGEFYVFAAGLPWPIESPAGFDYETALRGGGHRISISRDGVNGSTYLRLRPPVAFDPPILLVLTLLLERFRTHRRLESPYVQGTLPELQAGAHMQSRDLL